MEKIKKSFRLYFYLFLVMLFCVSGITAYASGQTVPDLTADGSISVTMKAEENQKPVPGGTLIIYHAADLLEKDGELIWNYTEDFESCGLVPDDISEEKFAELLENHIDTYGIKGTEKTIASNGTVVFENLTLGIYLIVQKNPADGYYPINSFVVSVPSQEEDGWNYHIDASPKMEMYTEKPPAEQETSYKPEVPEDTNEKGSTLFGSPRTGQEDRLIFAAAVLGIAVLAGGGILVVKHKKEKHTT